MLEALTNMMAASAGLTTSCLAMLVAALLPAPGTPAEAAAASTSQPGHTWEPSPWAVAVQDEVVQALQRVRVVSAEGSQAGRQRAGRPGCICALATLRHPTPCAPLLLLAAARRRCAWCPRCPRRF